MSNWTVATEEEIERIAKEFRLCNSDARDRVRFLYDECKKLQMKYDATEEFMQAYEVFFKAVDKAMAEHLDSKQVLGPAKKFHNGICEALRNLDIAHYKYQIDACVLRPGHEHCCEECEEMFDDGETDRDVKHGGGDDPLCPKCRAKYDRRFRKSMPSRFPGDPEPEPPKLQEMDFVVDNGSDIKDET